MAKKEQAAAQGTAEATSGAGVSPGMELTEAQKTQLALQQRMAADAGAGFEDANADAYAIPFLQILQSGSPQCKRSEGLYIPGAEEGMFFNTVTGEIFPGYDGPPDKDTGQFARGGLTLVPCHYTQRFIEWQPRESGGGFVNERMPDDPAALQTVKDEKGRDKLPNGNILVDTRNHYCLIWNEDTGMYVPVLATFSSTQLKKSRNWMSKMQGIKLKAGTKFVTAPMASRAYRVTTVPESNDKGSWFGWRIELKKEVDSADIYEAAQDFRNQIIAGRAKAAQPPAGDAAEPGIDA